MEGAHVASTDQHEILSTDDQRGAALATGPWRLLQLFEVGTQQLLQVGHGGPLPGDSENQPGGRNVFADRPAVSSAEFFDGIALASSLMELRPHRSEERRVGKECRSRWSP